MLNHFIFSLNATIPIFLIIVVGWLLKQRGMFNENFVSVINKYVFRVALPVLLFRDIAGSPITDVMEPKFCAFCLIGTALMFIGVWIFAGIFIKDKTMVGAFTQGAARGSTAVLGIAFAENIFGNSGMTPLMIVCAVPLYNIFSVLILTVCANDEKEKDLKSTIRKALIGIATNPIIWGIVIALPFSFFNITLPPIATKSVQYIAQTATPMALLAVGAGFEGSKAISKIKPTALATAIKLFILPAIYLPLAAKMGFTGTALVAILIMVGSPTTVTCYIMAKNMNNDDILSASIIVMATLLSSVSLTFWIFMLRAMGLI